MKIPRYWAKAHDEIKTRHGNWIAPIKWAWSDTSEEDARLKAADALKIILSRIKAGEPWPKAYDYGSNRPLREERIQEIDLPIGSEAVITRNVYGALVLNVDNVMFVDIDNDDTTSNVTQKQSAGDRFTFQSLIALLFHKLFGREPVSQVSQDPPSSGISNIPLPANPIDQIEKWTENNPGWVFRVYKTKSGYRLIAMHDLFQPDAAETLSILRELNCDPVYIRLCKNQKSFRARLTPKPWRLNRRVSIPPVKYPYEGRGIKLINKWVTQYEEASVKNATCKYLKTIGSGNLNATAVAVTKIHDQISKAEDELPLA